MLQVTDGRHSPPPEACRKISECHEFAPEFSSAIVGDVRGKNAIMAGISYLSLTPKKIGVTELYEAELELKKTYSLRSSLLKKLPIDDGTFSAG